MTLKNKYIDLGESRATFFFPPAWPIFPSHAHMSQHPKDGDESGIKQRCICSQILFKFKLSLICCITLVRLFGLLTCKMVKIIPKNRVF